MMQCNVAIANNAYAQWQRNAPSTISRFVHVFMQCQTHRPTNDSMQTNAMLTDEITLINTIIFTTSSPLFATLGAAYMRVDSCSFTHKLISSTVSPL
eukprot:scaffold492464_cov20-Prasinocladus_malaysianus.AAC.1